MIRKLNERSGLSAFAFLLSACFTLGGCGAVGEAPDVRLGVPYREQPPNSFQCGPASVLMWRLYDGLPEISQATIGAWMGNSSCGYEAPGIMAAVRHFTNTTDVYVDQVGPVHQSQFFSRQITSIDRGTPVIAILNGLHAGVVNGGKWKALSGGRYEWDYVYFHNPQVRANEFYASGDWVRANCEFDYETCTQIVSSSGVAGWQSNFASYGTLVQLYGFYCPDGSDQPICP